MKVELSQKEVEAAVIEYVKNKLHIDQLQAVMLDIKMSAHFSVYNASVDITDKVDD